MHGIDGGRLETEAPGHGHGSERPARESHGKMGCRTYRRPAPPRQPPTLHGAFYKSALYPLLERINAYLMRWMRTKFKRLRGRKKAQAAWSQAIARRPRFFAHWAWITHVPRVW